LSNFVNIFLQQFASLQNAKTPKFIMRFANIS
jgi:hypothetical protein